MTSNSLNELQDSDLPIIQYTTEVSIDKGIHISPFGLLEETGYCQRPKAVKRNSDLEIYSSQTGDLSFDIFSAIFYIVSRAEEYAPKDIQTDQHQRFKSEHSILNELGVTRIPIVHKWLEDLKLQLKQKYPDLHFPQREYTFQLSSDIDMAWSYKNKGLLRSGGALFKNLLTGKFDQLKNQLEVISNQKQDPFDNYNFLESLVPGQSILYFILLGKHGRYDKNISRSNTEFQELIKQLNRNHNIGIHPSYGAGSDNKKLNSELSLLEKIINKKVNASRQHYLKIAWPDTYRSLIKLGIKEDYSLGFFDNIGFRVGLCVPFPWYDLEKEEITELMLHPFQVMDVSLKNYLKLDPDQAIELAISIIKEVKKYNGDFHVIWHNSSFNGDWTEWLECLKKMVKEARNA